MVVGEPQHWAEVARVELAPGSAAILDSFELSSTTPVELVSGLPWWAGALVIVLSAGLAAVVVHSLFVVLTSQVLEKSDSDSMKTIIREIRTPLSITVFFIGVVIGAQLVPFERAVFALESGSVSLILLTWAYAIIRLANRLLTVDELDRSGREIIPVVKNVLSFVVMLTTVLVLMSVWQIDVTPILASAGILGIVLGIAAQDSLGNFFAGISLYFDRTYAIGDMIQLESGERGNVVDMSVRSTTILTRDNIAITVPNAELNSTQVINESAPIRRRRIRLNVGVAYGSDLETVERAILDAAAAEDVVLDSPQPKVRFREFADSAIVAQLQCFIDNPAQYGRAQDTLIRRIDRTFEEAEVKIPFPQREVTFFESGNEIALEPNDSRDASPQRGTEHEPLSSTNGPERESATPENHSDHDAVADDQGRVQFGDPDETD